MVQDIGKNENPYSFGQRIKDLLNLLLTKMQLDSREELIPLKTTMYKNTALQTYKRGLMHRGRIGELMYIKNPALQTYKRGLMHRGRIGELMYIKNPATLEAAMAEVLEHQNWQSISMRNVSSASSPLQEFYTDNTRQHEESGIKSKSNTKSVSTNQYQTNQFQTNQFRNNVPRPTYSQFQRQPQPHAKPSSFKFAKTSAQQLEKRQPRQQPMDIDPSLSRMRQQTPFGPAPSRNRFHVEELHQQEEEGAAGYEENYYEYQPVWDEDTEPFPWEPEEEPNFPVAASAPEETQPVNPPNPNQ
ncbi:hypothetical protein QE152_g9053 [Popillia japonica]|uniref:Uncharacterized protein n=1 Tax=Popillia japonica TaxID=7064 RepID=A0AAW1M057_POPJA